MDIVSVHGRGCVWASSGSATSKRILDVDGIFNVKYWNSMKKVGEEKRNAIPAQWLEEGELIELLASFNIIAIGKIIDKPYQIKEAPG